MVVILKYNLFNLQPFLDIFTYFERQSAEKFKLFIKIYFLDIFQQTFLIFLFIIILVIKLDSKKRTLDLPIILEMTIPSDKGKPIEK